MVKTVPLSPAGAGGLRCRREANCDSPGGMKLGRDGGKSA